MWVAGVRRVLLFNAGREASVFVWVRGVDSFVVCDRGVFGAGVGWALCFDEVGMRGCFFCASRAVCVTRGRMGQEGAFILVVGCLRGWLIPREL